MQILFFHRRACRFLGGLCVLASLVGATRAFAQPRPYLYGSGITWGQWLGLGDAQARQFDRNSMDKIVQMGGTHCPANFAWIDIEPTQGTFNWSYVDHQVNEARARGLEIFAYTGLTPDWALPPAILQQYGSGIGYRFPPDEQYIPQFENFFQTLAARYRGLVKYYEFWNEPNGCSWINDGCSNGHMAHTYTPWLIRWYAAMKQGDPDCVLAVGGLDYHSGVTQGYKYIEDIYTAGGGDSFDAVAIHPYGSPLHWQAITDTYNVLVNHGHGHKKLWLNEYGWNTTNETQKAADLTTVLTTLKQPQYNMVFMANYLVITDLPGTPDNGHDYGLCSRNLTTLTITPRASWNAFASLDKTFPPDVEFSAAPASGPLPLLVQFTDETYYPGATAWNWQFGDGGTSTLQNPTHTYVQDGYYAVQLTVTGPNGPLVRQKTGYIAAGSPPPISGVENPSFEANGGSLDGWTRVILSGDSYDNPPHTNGDYGLSTTDGTHYGGKITNSLRIDFYFGQVIGTSNWNSFSLDAGWQLSALVNLHARTSDPQPQGVHQVWEIGWNDDGSEPADIMSCDHYQTIADLTGADTGNDAFGFTGLARSGTLTGVPGLRGVALRIRFYNNAAWWWTLDNIDNVQFTLTSVPPPLVPGDRDADRDVDWDDLAAFTACRSGPSVGPVPPDCQWADWDNDSDVDHADFAVFQRCYTGPARAGDVTCAD